MSVPRKKRQKRNLVPIGTHVDLTTKMTIEALAQSQGKSVYELLQGVVTEMADEYDAELRELQAKPVKESDTNGEDLL